MTGSRLLLVVTSQVICVLWGGFLSFFWVQGCAAPTTHLAISCIFMLETWYVRRLRNSSTIRRLPSCRVYWLVSFVFSPSIFLVPGYSALTIPISISCIFMLETLNVRRVRINHTIQRLPPYLARASRCCLWYFLVLPFSSRL